MDNNLDNLTTDQLANIIGQVYGIDAKRAPVDKAYRLFGSGPNADKEYRRVVNPSYGLQEKVALIGVKCKSIQEEGKQSWANHFGWEEGEVEFTEELGKLQFHEKILPLICREDVGPFDPKDMSSRQVEEMWIDFFLST